MSLSAVCGVQRGHVTRQAAFSARTTRVAAPVRQLVCAAQQQAQGPTRREAAALSLLSVAAILQASPAKAFLGLGESAEEKYVKETSSIITDVRGVIVMDREDPKYDDSVKKVRKELNDWVAKYRRDNSYSGRPSFGNTYSALNALAGHYNSFGTNAPIPRKRLDRIEKELGDAEKFLLKGR